jgi:hypothetical protein
MAKERNTRRDERLRRSRYQPYHLSESLIPRRIIQNGNQLRFVQRALQSREVLRLLLDDCRMVMQEMQDEQNLGESDGL